MKAIEKAWGVTTPPPPPKVEICSDKYYLQNIAGWTICLDKKMTSADSMKARTVAKLDGDFKKIEGVLEAEIYNYLKKNVKIDVDYDKKTHGGVYHPG